MIRFFTFIVLASFIYMLMILADQELTNEFSSTYGERDFEAMSYVHPLFKFLQKGYDGSHRFKTLKNHQTNDIFTVPGIDVTNMNAKIFYNNFLT